MPGSLVTLLLAVSLAQAPTTPLSEPAPVSDETRPVGEGALTRERHFGLHVGVNLGLFAADLTVSHVYVFVSGNAGYPAVSSGALWGAWLGFGYALELGAGRPSRWYMDVFFLVGALGQTNNLPLDGFSVPLGLGLGFRYQHKNGFTLGFKLPVFGGAVGPAVSYAGNTGTASIERFYLASGVALPFVSLGYTF